jgi:hypothetical protein
MDGMADDGGGGGEGGDSFCCPSSPHSAIIKGFKCNSSRSFFFLSREMMGDPVDAAVSYAL